LGKLGVSPKKLFFGFLESCRRQGYCIAYRGAVLALDLNDLAVKRLEKPLLVQCTLLVLLGPYLPRFEKWGRGKLRPGLNNYVRAVIRSRKSGGAGLH
jgi:hypothetical protein